MVNWVLVRVAIESEGRHIPWVLKTFTYYHHFQINFSLLHSMSRDNVRGHYIDLQIFCRNLQLSYRCIIYILKKKLSGFPNPRSFFMSSHVDLPQNALAHVILHVFWKYVIMLSIVAFFPSYFNITERYKKSKYFLTCKKLKKCCNFFRRPMFSFFKNHF